MPAAVVTSDDLRAAGPGNQPATARWGVEGVNMGGILLGYLAVLVVGLVALASVGLRLAGGRRAARVVFAGGLLTGTVIATGGVLTCPGDLPAGEVALAAVTLLLAGVGPFVAALRRPGALAAALACATVALGALAWPYVGGSDMLADLPGGRVVGGTGAFFAAPVLALAGLLVAVLPPVRPRGAVSRDG
jgi:hypothetical protein